MELIQLRELYDRCPQLNVARSLMSKPNENLHLYGLCGSSASLVLASLFHSDSKNMVIIQDDLETAGYLYHDLVQLLGEQTVNFYPSSFKRSIRLGRNDAGNTILRTEALQALRQDTPCVVVTYPDALLEKVVSPDELKTKTIAIHKGELLDNAFVIELLQEYGFERVDYVYEPGQFATRGSLIDVYSWSHELPFRIDFFGDEVESIRTFNIESQLSVENYEEIKIVPFSENQNNDLCFLFNYLKPEDLLCFSDFEYTIGKINILLEDTGDKSPDKLMTPEAFIEETSHFRWVEFGRKSVGNKSVKITFDTSPQDVFGKNFEFVSQSFQKYLDNNYQLCVLSDSEKQVERLKTIFEDRGDPISFTPILKTLHEGFIDNHLKIACFTDHQIFERYHKYNLKSDKTRNGKLALSLKEIVQFQFGDYVVHIDHGVGRFAGLFRTELNGKMQEVIKIVYKDDDTIFVSIHNLHRISKYKGKEGTAPTIHKLGGAAWSNIKEKTKKKVKDIARDLIKLYAQRKQEEGFQFSPDSYLQQELEASFVYEDTPDQFKATNDLKNDMESSKPMDRLICGDVGFGKTEVAIRAAFKAVTDGKQVAVLVPTTVLALQHYKTFSNRLKEFPCKVDYLSRTRKTTDAQQVVKALKDGKIDIIIGTHKLIGKSIGFKDLGLLIIDEEQKFGVSVKEKLKSLKVNIDTLTMTATPIPRTLQFSLMGARDLSIISTPPPNRYPVQTEVAVLSEELIKEAIEFELGRNGQVFFINNRVQQLPEIERLIKRCVPEARTVIAHGQMEGEKLEKIIMEFMDEVYDVLICTTIVESGIDIPNANTIFINNAHQFGLSDLHQLRGRVGRSNKKAFCYLVAPPLQTLTADARRRLQAIENFAELGSGFNISMQDLDIRGAGNMLGAEQSGFIADLGYETYQKILNEAVQELKSEEFADLFADEPLSKDRKGQVMYVTDCLIESDLEMYFPESYVPGSSERMMLYREMDNLEEEQGIQAFIQRLTDRFGPIPKVGLDLIDTVRLRCIAKTLGMEKIQLRNGRMTCYFVSQKNASYYQSDVFDKILQYAQNQIHTSRLREINSKRSLQIEKIENIENALVQLKLMQ